MKIDTAARQELKFSQLRNILPHIFGEIDDDIFNSILPFLKWKELLGNEYLFHQGDIGDCLFVLISGRLQVVKRRPNGREEIIGEIIRGEAVGEMALFTGEPRTAGIVAVRDSNLVQISRSDFEQIISQCPKVVMNISRQIINRLNTRNSNEHHLEKVVNIALVPLSEGIDLQKFSWLLVGKLSEYGDVLHLSPKLVDQMLGQADIAHCPSNSVAYHRLTTWLDEQEANHDFLVYQAEKGFSEWTKRCLRQADEILLIGEASDDPALREIEREQLSGFHKLTTAGQSLILLRSNEKNEITNTQQWLSRREVKSHHHLVKNSEGDMARLARFITGNAIGLVLSGGGAKGLAHIGVYQALEEHGIPIDMVGGTSIGALVGGPMALCWPAKKLYDEARKAFLANPTPLGDYNLFPIISLLKGRRLNSLITDFLGNINIEDMELNYFCVASNLSKTEVSVIRKGVLSKAIRASASLPGIFPPVIIESELHIDGGIFNNLPIDIMEEMGVGHIIAVDLDVSDSQAVEIDCVPSTWQILKGKVWGKKKYHVPSLIATLIQSTTLNSDQKTRQLRNRADLYFNPDLSKFGLIDWKSYNQIVEAGYRHAVDVLQNWEGFEER